MDSVSSLNTSMMLSAADWQSVAQSGRFSESQKLEVSADEFEATLVRQYLKDALKPHIQGIFNENGTAQEIYRGFLTDALANNIVRSGPGLGISSALQTQLSTTNTTKETDAS